MDEFGGDVWLGPPEHSEAVVELPKPASGS